MASLTFLACTQTPKLLECSPVSVLRAIMAASVTGLEFNGPLGHAWLIPYGGEATFVPGYRGLIDLVVRGGGARSVGAHLVWRCDEFDIQFGSRPRIHHKPDFDARDEIAQAAGDDFNLFDEIRGAYMVAELPTGGFKTDFMPVREIEKRRAQSRAGSGPDSPWVKWPEEMVRKTPIRHGVKELPLSADRIAQRLGAALELDNRLDTGTISNPIPEFDDQASLEAAIQEATAQRADALRERVQQQAAQMRGRDVSNVANQQQEPADQHESQRDSDEQLPPDEQQRIEQRERDLFGR